MSDSGQGRDEPVRQPYAAPEGYAQPAPPTQQFPAPQDRPAPDDAGQQAPGARARVRSQEGGPGAVNPLRGMASDDVLRDAAAAVALLVSLALPWDYRGGVGGTPVALLVTLLSVLSLGVTYLARSGLMPDVRTSTFAAVRAAANGPYALAFVVLLVTDLARGDGVGTGAGLGLAGALLAGLPHRCDHAGDDGHVPVRTRRAALLVVAATAGAGALCSLVVAVVAPPLGIGGAFELLVSLTSAAMVTVLLVVPAVLAARGDGAPRWVLLGLGTAAAVVLLLSASGALPFGTVESLRGPGFGEVLLPAAAAAAAVPGSPGPRGVQLWVGVGVRVMQVLVVLAAVAAVQAVTLLALPDASDLSAGVVLLLSLAVTGVAAVAQWRARQGAGQRRALLLLAATAAVLSLAALLVAGSIAWLSHVVGGLGVPAIATAALLLPASMREEARRAQQRQEAPATEHPPVLDVLTADPAAAADPATPLQALADIAYRRPDLRPYVAQNPSAWPELLDWLAAFQDPRIDAALAARGAQPPPH